MAGNRMSLGPESGGFTSIRAGELLRDTPFDALPFSADSNMSIGSR
jgi:hypothetical protein